MRGILPLGVAVAALALAGCGTALDARRVPPGHELPVRGVLYSLPMAAFDVEARVLVVSCKATAAAEGPLAYELAGGTIRAYFVPDPDETYGLDYSRLNSALKTTMAGVTLHLNGMLKSIDAHVEDRTAQVAGAVVGTALNLYKASIAGVAAPAMTQWAAAVPPSPVCQAINQKAARRNRLMVSDIPAAKGSANAAVLEAELEALSKALTATLRLTAWSPAGRDAQACEPVTASQRDFLDAFARREGLSPMAGVSGNARFSMEVCVAPLAASARPAPGPSRTAPEPATGWLGGVVYRSPVHGRVWIQDPRQPSLSRIEAQELVKLPQFGVKGLVWLENEGFDKNEVAAEFNEDGSLSKLDFSSQSRAERMAGSLSEASGSVAELARLRAEAREARAQQAAGEPARIRQEELATLDHEISVLEKKARIEKLREELSQPE